MVGGDFFPAIGSGAEKVIHINVKADIDRALRKVRFVQEQVPFATALALTKTAQAVKAAEVIGMRESFAQPTNYTLNSLRVTRAEKARLLASVAVRGGESGEGAVRWLRPEIRGGARSHAIEAMLQPLGLPPPGMWAVPGSAAKKTSGGKIDINWLRSLISDISEQGVSNARGVVTKGIKGTRRRKGQGELQYVVLFTKWGKLLPGIYGRRGRGIFPFVLFVREPKYAKKYDFYGIAMRTAMERFPSEFKVALAKAMATAR